MVFIIIGLTWDLNYITATKSSFTTKVLYYHYHAVCLCPYLFIIIKCASVNHNYFHCYNKYLLPFVYNTDSLKMHFLVNIFTITLSIVFQISKKNIFDIFYKIFKTIIPKRFIWGTFYSSNFAYVF